MSTTTEYSKVDLRVGTDAQFQDNLDSLPVGAIWGSTDSKVTEDDLSDALKTKINDSVTVQVVNIDSPATATNGTLTAAQLATLQASDQNYIMFNHEKYYLGDKGHQEGFLTYSHVGYENGSHFLKSITITISTLAWVLNTTECVDKSDIPSGGSSISWHTEAPSDTSKVLMTKCTCTACPDYEQFVGMTTLVYGYINTTSYSALAWQKVHIDPNSTNAVVFLGKFGPAAELGQYLEGPKYLSWQNAANGPDYTENTVAYEYLY